VGLDGFAEAPGQAAGADGHGVAAAVGLTLELRKKRKRDGQGEWRKETYLSRIGSAHVDDSPNNVLC
jgi:hypothetical protein